MIKKDLIDKMVNENAVVEIINFYQFWDFFKELKSFSFSKNNITKKDFSVLYSKDNVVYLSLDTVDGKVIVNLKDKNSLYENTEILPFEKFYDTKILKKYNLHIDEEFYIVGNNDKTYIATLNGNIYLANLVNNCEDIWSEIPPYATVFDILNDNLCVRTNYKPKFNQEYYYIEYALNELLKLDKDKSKICKKKFDSYSDLLRWKAGNFFYNSADINTYLTK